jgi:hypothetical protein
LTALPETRNTLTNNADHRYPPSLFAKPSTKLFEIAKGDVRERDGYRITTPLRTLLDVAASQLSPEHLQAGTSEALKRGLVRRRA